VRDYELEVMANACFQSKAMITSIADMRACIRQTFAANSKSTGDPETGQALAGPPKGADRIV
jgi:hypothetical protein